MAYVVDRVVICDAFREPERHYQLLSGGRSKLAAGRSMEPTIRNGDYVVFRAKPAGTPQGKVVLAQYRGPADPETGGAFTVKRYSSEKTSSDDGGWRHTRVVLSPTNPEYQPIVLAADDAEHVEVIAEMVTVLRGGG